MFSKLYLCNTKTYPGMRIFHISFILLIFFSLSSTVTAQFLPSNDGSAGQLMGGSQPSSHGKQNEGKSGETTSTENDTLRIFAYKLDAFLGEKSVVDFDTVTLNFQNSTLPERLKTISASHLGSFGSPFQSRIINDRTSKSAFLFMKPYENWLKFPEDMVFVNITKLYTNIRYLTTTGDDKSQEEDFQFTFTGNINKHLNIGADYNILYSRGYYSRTAIRDKLANIYSNYQSPRYEAFLKASFDYLENFENGGITDDRYITQPLLMSGGLREYESLNIPVNLADARNRLNHQQLFFNHKYHIGFEEKNSKDSLLNDFIPVTSIIHTVFLDRSQKNYYSKTINKQFYDTIANISEAYTSDSAALFHIRNTVGLSLREGFHEWVKMGLTAFIEHDFKKYTSYSPDAAQIDSNNVFSRLGYHNENLLWAGAELYKRQGSILTYSALAKLCVLGDHLGDFELSGNLKTDLKFWNRPVMISANGFVKNLQPDYFLENYYSNHFSWKNSFSNEYKTKVFGAIEIPDFGLGINVSVENLTNFVYFNNSALPEQFLGNIQVFTANWKQHLNLGILNWDNDVVYQVSSDKILLPIPSLTVYSNLYIKTTLSKVLTTYIGVDCRYFTSYHANSYMPATGQFYTQQDITIGNYPYMNVYGNFHLKRMRFFAMYSHLSRLFADPQYFSTPHHPLNPTALRIGLSWNFYD